jgi:FkbM family methyltransferase
MIKSLIKALIRSLGLEGVRSKNILISQVQSYDPKAALVDGKVASCGLLIDAERDRWVLESLPILVDLQNHAGFTFKLEGARLTAVREKVSFEIVSMLEAGMIFDIYARGVYRLLTGDPFLLIDVGSNIGVSAVYAASELGAEVYGFELIPSLASRAMAHVDRNGLGQQVYVHPVGLGKSEEQIEVLFSEEHAGSTSLHLDSSQSEGAIRVPCQIRSVEVLREILAKSTKRNFMKLDCEGAEYSILEALQDSSLLKEFSGFLLEYHEIPGGKGRVWLEEFFVQHGFDVHSFLKPGFNHEMMYAFRR